MDDLICFKGTRNGVTLILNDAETDFQKIIDHLKQKMSHLNFFKGAVVNIDIGQRKPLSPAELDSLEEILSSNNIKINDVVLNSKKPSPSSRLPEQSVQHEKGDTLLISKTVRSGQRLAYLGNIMLIGDVHVGGEVIAQGNVIVWGSIKGTVHAGSQGNDNAFIIALQLDPTQLRIGKYIGCAPDQGSPDLPKRPEIAYIKNNKIIIADYNKSKNMLANLAQN
ncbi:MAG: septum site-determining protein MinC [Syntrophaceticus sp.]|nr:septum site-determining protein MinC [Syntrophaceticus sp.]